MTPYWIVYLTPLLGLFSPFRANLPLRKLSWTLVGAALVFFVGLRHEVGMDWFAYLSHFNQELAAETEPLWINEPAYVLLMWAFARLGLDLHAVNAVCAAVFVSGLLTFAARQPFRWLALTISIPYLVIIVGMNNTRQSVALGLLFFGLLALEKGQIRKFVLLVLAGAMFHASALACLLLAALKVPGRRIRYLLVLGALGVVVAVAFLAELYATYAQAYGVDAQLQSSGAGVRVAINVVAFLTMLALRRAWKERFGWDNLWFWMGLSSLILLPLVPLASTAIDRMALYLMPLQLYVWGRAPVLIPAPWRAAVVATLVAFYAAVLWVWLAYATNSISWFPYQNVLLGVQR